MNGKITAKPKVEAFGGFRIFQSINGYAHRGLTPDLGGKRERGYNDDKWTEYFNVDYGEVVDNPDYDPEAEPGRDPNSREYILQNEAVINDHGDEYKSRGQMQREYSTAKKGYVYDDDGNKYIQYKKKGRWVYYGTSERIKCSHRLVDEIEDTDTRLAKNQKYRVEVWWKLDYLTWDKDEEDFKVVHTDATWHVQSARLNATSPDSMRIKILTRKNTRVNSLTTLGNSQLYWASKTVHEPCVDYYIVWERAHHDELNNNSN